MKNKRSWILLGGIVLINTAFLLLNFRLAVSNTQTTKLLFTTDLGDNIPVSMQGNDKINVVLAGESPLVSALQNALTEKMNKAGIADYLAREIVAVLNTYMLGNAFDDSLLWISFSPKNLGGLA